MSVSRNLRLLLVCIVLQPWSASAIDHIDIHIGEIQHPSAQIENLSVTLNMAGEWQGSATIKQVHTDQITPSRPVKFSKGSVQGKAEFSGVGYQLQHIKADMSVSEVAFSDEAGLKAAEKLTGQIKVQAHRQRQDWGWDAQLDWRDGELFWQPLYFAGGGHRLEGRGEWSDDHLSVEQGVANIAGVGAIKFDGELGWQDKSIRSLNCEARNWSLESAYPLLIKPFMEKGLLGDSEIAGRADFAAHIKNQKFTGFSLGLREVDVADKKNRFAFYKLNALIPWSYDDKTSARMSYGSGQLLGMSLGAAQHELELERYSMVASQLDFPVLDGKLVLQNTAAAIVNDQWYWRVQAEVQGVTMPEFSHALGWPRMEGKMDAQIPMVLYQNGKLTTNGALKLKVFDGDIRVDNLAMDQPLMVTTQEKFPNVRCKISLPSAVPVQQRPYSGVFCGFLMNLTMEKSAYPVVCVTEYVPWVAWKLRNPVMSLLRVAASRQLPC